MIYLNIISLHTSFACNKQCNKLLCCVTASSNFLIPHLSLFSNFPVELQIRHNEYQINTQDLLMVLCLTHTHTYKHNWFQFSDRIVDYKCHVLKKLFLVVQARNRNTMCGIIVLIAHIHIAHMTLLRTKHVCTHDIIAHKTHCTHDIIAHKTRLHT